ncbi:MAG: 30S ribosomal protein S17 [Candidatus Aminicenantes bacterium]|nr:MAG: 30S ribosomal protein S17 [Candidatus Aminicenantes bacterium]
MVVQNIGLNVPSPTKTCDDKFCPFHGRLSIRGKTLSGTVVNDRMTKTIVVEHEFFHYVRKYMRYEKRRSKIMARNPPCIEAKRGDEVMIAECRPISKEVSFVVIKK